VSNAVPPVPAPIKLNASHWLILCIAAIGFAFDTYALLVMPIIARPALAELLSVDPDTASGTQAILDWTGYIMWGSALCGGIFGLLGGYLTDWLGRRRVLMWSILLYAFSALASGLVDSPWLFLALRCSTFVGVCLEFVAAVAWLAELFPNPHQRETILGYTQAFSSLGGILVTMSYYLVVQFRESFPLIPIIDTHGGSWLYSDAAWRYTLISGVIPAIPLILIRPFLPESPAWQRKRAAGTLQRPSFAELFQGKLRRTSLVTAALFACGFGAAFGAIQMTPQMVPGLRPDLAPLPGLREAYEAGKNPDKRQDLAKREQDLEEKLAKAAAGSDQAKALQLQLERTQKSLKLAMAASKSESKLQETRTKVENLQKEQEETVASVQFLQEIGGLAGRFVLAWLAIRIVSRRKLLWAFQIPGLCIIPLVYFFPAAGNLPENNLEILRAGMFFVGFFTVAQFSFWGNYLPRVFPMRLRGTGESFAANVGGRMVGTGANFLTTRLAPLILAAMPTLARPSGIAYAAAIVALLVYALGTGLTSLLPEPPQEEPPD
jgi:MFS family permease